MHGTIHCPEADRQRLFGQQTFLLFVKRMTEATAPDSHDMNMLCTRPMPVQAWHTESTAQSIALRVAADSPMDPNAVYSFMLEPEQARQLIRDLSSAVHASDLKKLR